jgi:hypothetical protein
MLTHGRRFPIEPAGRAGHIAATDEKPGRAQEQCAAYYLAEQLADMRGEANKTISTIRTTMSRRPPVVQGR